MGGLSKFTSNENILSKIVILNLNALNAKYTLLEN